ncbi:hypothetical protein DRP53_05465 [candidate division WOR-3 bacterium]|uniref:DUF4412 domain-containing protein n=1 Tax=candidate division WOR-3 bacterium TaxID=2052148 RepID=A0A660SK40_UNCW3|nr:MAG: hypothetical protein DRP53_05465 [candidate division WOR-3 bacterium]
MLKVKALLIIFSSLSAGVIMRSQLKIGGKEEIEVWYLEGDNIRYDSGERSSLIYTGCDQKVRGVDWLKREYFQTDLEGLEALIGEREPMRGELKTLEKSSIFNLPAIYHVLLKDNDTIGRIWIIDQKSFPLPQKLVKRFIKIRDLFLRYFRRPVVVPGIVGRMILYDPPYFQEVIDIKETRIRPETFLIPEGFQLSPAIRPQYQSGD